LNQNLVEVAIECGISLGQTFQRQRLWWV